MVNDYCRKCKTSRKCNSRLFPVLIKEEKPRGALSALFSTFNQKTEPGRGRPPTVKRVLSGCCNLEGFGDTFRGVKRFSTSLCNTPLCGGFVGHNRPVSGWEEGYSQGEKGLIPPCIALPLQHSAQKCHHPHCPRLGLGTTVYTGRRVQPWYTYLGT